MDQRINSPRLFIAIALFLALLIRSATAVSGAVPTVGALRCEYRRDPLGLDATQPRLSWTIESSDRCVMQSAYRILVASTLKLLAANQGDCWDSRKVTSNQSIQIPYSGAALRSFKQCFWKVQVWDSSGNVSAWSAPGMWSMGLLKPADWKGQWIGLDAHHFDAGAKAPPAAPLLRKPFVIRGHVARATAYICALGYDQLFINGQRVGDRVLDPPVTQFDQRGLYVTQDVTTLVTTGNNAVGVELGSSWYNTTVPDAWGFDKAPWRALPKMRFQMNIELTDGTVQEIVSDDSWKISTGPVLFEQTRVGEIYDARLEKHGWSTADYDDATWQNASVREGFTGAVSSCFADPIKVVATLKPVKMTQPMPGTYVFDMGQNLAGWPRLTVSAPAGTVIKLKCGELLNPDGTVTTKGIGQHVKSPDFQCDTYICKGGGVETWEPAFTYHGFQYVEATGFVTGPAKDAVVAQVVRSAFDPAGSFECSDPMLNKIEHAAVWAYTSNFVGIPTDCPHREKNGWTGDAHLAAAMGLEHFHAEPDYAQWIDTLQDAMHDDGKLPGIAPTPGWGYTRLDGPAWESAYLLIPWEMYKQSGDRRILESHYEGFKKWADYYTRISKNHIVEYGLGDWSPVKTKSPASLTSTAYYYRDLQILAITAKLLNKTDDADHFSKLASEVRNAFNSRFFDPKTREYGGGTQTSLSFALCFGLVEDPQREGVARNLADKVRQSHLHIDTGILGARYLLRALSDNGYPDLAWTVATQQTAPSWGSWINQGATTLWEEWNGTNSHNHIMFGDISAWFIEYLAGIRLDPSEVGYKKIIIHPLLLGNLESAKATRESMYGTISSEWARVDNAFQLKIVVPANTTATVFVPAKSAADVRESDRPISNSPGVTFLRMDGSDAVFSVGSGTYYFTALTN